MKQILWLLILIYGIAGIVAPDTIDFSLTNANIWLAASMIIEVVLGCTQKIIDETNKTK